MKPGLLASAPDTLPARLRGETPIRPALPFHASLAHAGDGEAAIHRDAVPGAEASLEVLANDGMIDIVAQGFDAGIRLGEHVQRDMVAVRVTPELRTAIVGSPGYFATHPAPRTPRDLRAHACINYRWVASGALYRWEFERGTEVVEVAVEGPLTLDDPDLMIAAALDGVGLASVMEGQVAHHLAAGRLVRVLEDWCPSFPGFFLYYPGRRQMPAALRALVDFLQGGGG